MASQAFTAAVSARTLSCGVAEGRLKLTAEFPETVLPSPFVWEGYDPLFPSGASRLAAFSLSQEFEVCGVSLVVDANRDGNLIFDGESRDITSPGNPYKFWTNSDFDDAFDQSTIFYTEFEQDDREVSSVEQEDWRRDRPVHATTRPSPCRCP